MKLHAPKAHLFERSDLIFVGPIVNSTSPTQDVSMLKSQSIRIPFLPFYRLELELELQLQPSIRPCFLGVDHQMVISSNTQAVGKL